MLRVFPLRAITAATLLWLAAACSNPALEAECSADDPCPAGQRCESARCVPDETPGDSGGGADVTVGVDTPAAPIDTRTEDTALPPDVVAPPDALVDIPVDITDQRDVAADAIGAPDAGGPLDSATPPDVQADTTAPDAGADVAQACVPGASCAGDPCGSDGDCFDGRCDNGFCCVAGTCCHTAADCPETFAEGPTCDDPATCQGTRRDADCVDFACEVGPSIDDDSACGVELVLDCAPYPDVACTGEPSQAAPVCGEACGPTTPCSDGHYCGGGVCQPVKADGLSCAAAEECAAGFCANGFCCDGAGGDDCCAEAADCPEGYASPPVCEDTAACRGSRVEAVCADFVCASSAPRADDSGCGADVEANACGPFPAVFCSGATDQQPPQCPTSCASDADCDDGAHCDGVCAADLPNGASCDEDSDCRSGRCRNGACCDAGDCCRTEADCPPRYASPPACDDPARCEGTRVEPECVDYVCESSAPIPDDSACGPDIVLDCDPYPDVSCTGASSQAAPVCGSACGPTAPCSGGYYCGGGVCQPVKADGLSCAADGECAAGFCANGFCCDGAGDDACCAEAADCPDAFRSAPVCEDRATCQGTRVDAVCAGSVCGSSAPRPDDSDCGPEVEALTCGPYASVFCGGAADQPPPECPTSCTSDAACDDDAHCDGVCVADLVNGSSCDEDSDCRSGRCRNGACCDAGDCCRTEADCPDQYATAPTCDDEATCQGTRRDADCVDFVCTEGPPVEDDSACGPELVFDCTPYPDVACTGATSQSPPACGDTCQREEDCVAGYHCDGTCQPDLANGLSCDESSDCQSGHCRGGFCCASGDCCATDADCPTSYTETATCDDTATCDGHRTEARCTANTCASVEVDDDSACGPERVVSDCGPYPTVTCDGADTQTAPSCATSCASEQECDAGYHCDANACVPDLGDGGVCDEATDCQSGHCQNGYCCASGDCCVTTADCADGNQCTDDVCTGSFQCTNAENTASCDDGDPCTTDETCSGGVCGGGSPSVGVSCGETRRCDEFGDCVDACGAIGCPLLPGYTSYCNASGHCEYEPTASLSDYETSYGVLVWIPSGTVTLTAFSGHVVSVPGFWVDKYETTAGAYATFLTARGSNTCGGTSCVGQGNVEWDATTGTAAPTPHCGERCADHPANKVTWLGADLFCEWLPNPSVELEWGLCSESEWTRSGTDDDDSAYPWGTTSPAAYPPVRANCSNCGDGYVGTAPVGSFPDGNSPFGVADLSGNVFELMEDDWQTSAAPPTDGSAWVASPRLTSRVYKGGSYDVAANTEYLELSSRYGVGDTRVFDTVGFRCCLRRR